MPCFNYYNLVKHYLRSYYAIIKYTSTYKNMWAPNLGGTVIDSCPALVLDRHFSVDQHLGMRPHFLSFSHQNLAKM